MHVTDSEFMAMISYVLFLLGDEVMYKLVHKMCKPQHQSVQGCWDLQFEKISLFISPGYEAKGFAGGKNTTC